MIHFIQLEFGRIGSDSHITPREVIRDFIELLDIIYQNPNVNVGELITSQSIDFTKLANEEASSVDDEFAEFEI